MPALLAGNTVVIKPSDITPLCGQRYAEAAQAAGLPPGVLNVVAGTGDVGAAMVAAAGAARPVLHRQLGGRPPDPRGRARSARAARRARDGRQERRASSSTTARCARRCTRSRSAATCRRPALHRHRARARPSQDRRPVHRRARDGRARAASSATPRIRRVFAGPLATHGALDKVEARARGRAQGRRRADRARARSCPAASTARRRCTGCPTACTTSPATPTSRCSGRICASR